MSSSECLSYALLGQNKSIQYKYSSYKNALENQLNGHARKDNQ